MRDTLLQNIEIPIYTESNDPKKASKSYWKYLTIDKGMQKNELYQIIIDSEQEKCQHLVAKIKIFLERSN
jgi:hypothetical protein